MKLVILESPYSGDVRVNLIYARSALKDSLSRNEAPIASHLLYTQPGVLDDSIVPERKLGMTAGLAWRFAAELQAFYTDLGWSSGMLEAFKQCLAEKRNFELRALWGPIKTPGIIQIKQD